MFKKWSIVLAFLVLGSTAYTQTNPADTVITPPSSSLFDTTLNYDELMQDLDTFLDSLLMPHS